MAAQQAVLHARGRQGQEIARQAVGGEPTSHKAPFDLVDFQSGLAWEVKTRSRLVAMAQPIGIEAASMRRKRAFLRKYHLRGRLLVVVIGGDETDIDLYAGPLKAHQRISALCRVKGGEARENADHSERD